MDLIDKHNAIDVVNDAIAEYIPLLDGECIKIPLAIARAIMNMPSAKSNVIRCKDCKWWGRKDVYKDGSTMIVCKKGRSIDPNGFCHYAEVREEEEDDE